MSEKTKAEQLKEKLYYTPQTAAETLSAEEMAQADAYCTGYMHYLDNAKTEREAVTEAIVRIVPIPCPSSISRKAGAA